MKVSFSAWILSRSFKITLFKWTGQGDLVIGTLTANRTRHEIEGLIGCFIELLPLRSKLFADQTTLEFLQQVKETVLEAYVHQELPFGKIVEGIKSSRRRNQTPLYNVAFLMQNFGSGRHPQGAVQFTNAHLSWGGKVLQEVGSLLDLRFIVIPQERTGEMRFIAEYKTDLFNQHTIYKEGNALLLRDSKSAWGECDFGQLAAGKSHWHRSLYVT